MRRRQFSSGRETCVRVVLFAVLLAMEVRDSGYIREWFTGPRYCGQGISEALSQIFMVAKILDLQPSYWQKHITRVESRTLEDNASSAT
jgi:hypothetical protein